MTPRTNQYSSTRMQRRNSRRGSLLIVVLITIVVLSLSAYTFTALMQTEEEAVRLQTRQVQSKYLVDSGIDYTRLFLSQSENTIREKGGRWDNELIFSGIQVAVQNTNPNVAGYFSAITSSLDDDGNPDGFRYGLTDESSKIHLNTLLFLDLYPQYGEGAARDLLMTLPEMTEEIADAILDWIDADDEVRDFGTESSYYQGENPAYACKNGPMDSLDELLLVRGVTPQLLFGLDTNRNGVLDAEELQASDADSTESDMYLGWANYLTLFSKESNLTSEGLTRININAEDLDQLYDDLKSAFNDEWANFILYYRISPDDNLAEVGDLPENWEPSEVAKFEPDLTQQSQRTFNSVLDLVNLYIKMDDDLDSLNRYAPSPVRLENLPFTIPTLMATLTTFEGDTIPGRINIMEAPRRVLLGIPGLDEETVDRIIYARGDDYELDDPDGADMNRRYETWLMVEGIVPLETMKQLMPLICARGDVYRAEIIGYFPDAAGSSRAEVVFDTTEEIPRILFWRDKSHLRNSYSVETLGVNIAQ